MSKISLDLAYHSSYHLPSMTLFKKTTDFLNFLHSKGDLDTQFLSFFHILVFLDRFVPNLVGCKSRTFES